MPWHSPTIIGLLVAAGVSWVGFWVAEKHAKMPVAPVKLFVRWEWRNVPLMFGEWFVRRNVFEIDGFFLRLSGSDAFVLP